MAKANHPALNINHAPSKSPSQQSIASHDQAEHIISDLKVDQTLPVSDTTGSIPVISNKHTHQQSNTSKVAKKKPKQLSERHKLEDTWNTPELLEQFSSRTRGRRSAQANQAIQQAESQSIQYVEGQNVQQAESIKVNHPTNDNEPTTVSMAANVNTMIAQDIIPMQPTPSSSASLKRKATHVDLHGALLVNESNPQPTETINVAEMAYGYDDVFQPSPLQPQSQPKAAAKSNPKATTAFKSKTPRKKADPKTATPRKRKIQTTTASPSFLASSAVQSTMPPNSTVSSSSSPYLHLSRHAPYQYPNTPGSPYTSSSLVNTQMQSPVDTHMQPSANARVQSPTYAHIRSLMYTHMQSPMNTHMQSPANAHLQSSTNTNSPQHENYYSRHYYSSSPTTYQGPPRHPPGSRQLHQNSVSPHQAPVSSHQVPAPFIAPHLHYPSLAVEPALSTSRADTTIASMTADSGTVHSALAAANDMLGINHADLLSTLGTDTAAAFHSTTTSDKHYLNSTGELMAEPRLQQPSATTSVTSQRKRTTTPRTKGEQKTKAKVARQSKGPKAQTAAAPVTDATDSSVIAPSPLVNTANPVPTSSNASQVDLPLSLDHVQGIRVSENETNDTVAKEPVLDAIHLEAKETVASAAVTKIKPQTKTPAKTQKKSNAKTSRKLEAPKAGDATDMIAAPLPLPPPPPPPSSATDTAPTCSTSNVPEASSSTDTNALNLAVIEEANSTMETKAKTKANTPRKKASHSKPNAPETDAVDTPMMDATDDTAVPFSPLIHNAALAPMSEAPEASSSATLDAIGNEEMVSATKAKAETLPKAKTPRKPQTSKAEAVDTLMMSATGTIATALPSTNDALSMPAINAPQTDLPKTSTNSKVIDAVDSEAIDTTTNEVLTDTVNLAENGAAANTTAAKGKGKGKSKAKRPAKATPNAKSSGKAKAPKAPKAQKVSNTPKAKARDGSMMDATDNDATSSTSIHDAAQTPSIEALGTDLPSTSQAVSSLVDKEAVDIAITEAAQDTTYLAENETVASTTKATKPPKAKSPRKPKATPTSKTSTKPKAPSKKKTYKAKAVETPAIEAAASEATLSSPLANADSLDQENQVTSTASDAVPTKKRKRTSSKKATESVEQQDMKDVSTVVDATDGNKAKKRKGPPESNTSASRRQSTRQRKKPKYRDEDDDHIMLDVYTAAATTTTATATPVEATEDEQVQEQDPAQFQTYIESRDSFLVDEDFKVLIPQLMSGLPIDEQAKLAKLLPPPDLEGATASNPIPVTFLSPSNTHFWEAVNKFQEILGMGGFEPESIKEREAMRAAELQDDTFKDDNYEAYWGERLERDKKQKAAAKAKADRAANRGRGRGGRGGGRSGGRGGNASRDKGKTKAV
ncbi:uncharacterized protein ATC70_002847 [Mucor velutinosus]|uniref:ASX DEUBAD domain-containing protein n=1 Tax=Mucor velutinosus TaxID=708070 RepID=A0AAN7DD37_9FUNG|nr:hypothetical protein ATC70_002847 [Mucor velutinosus]